MKQLKPLHKLLNAALRFMFGLPNSTPTTQFLAQCHILPFPYRIKYKLCYYISKVTYGSALGYLSAIFLPRLPLRTNLRFESDKIATAMNYSQGTIARHMCEVRQGEDFENYKKKLKTFHFRKAFVWDDICLAYCSYCIIANYLVRFFSTLDRFEMLECYTSGTAFFYRAVYKYICNNNNNSRCLL